MSLADSVWILILLFAFFWAHYPVVGLLRSFQIMDHPNERSSHAIGTVRGGGVLFSSVTSIVAIVTGLWKEDPTCLRLGCCSILVLVVSLVDDIKSVRASRRLLVHLVAAGIFSFYTLQDEMRMVHAPFEWWAFILLGIVCVAFIAGCTNAFNFMDGINGLAASQGIFNTLAFSLVYFSGGQGIGQGALLAIGTLGLGCLAFLPHNFPQARVFMGDVGSAYIGFIVGCYVVWIYLALGWGLALVILLMNANFLLDTGITLLRRVLRGDRWHEAHREHFYQRLVRSGSSHVWGTGCEAFLQLLSLIYLYWLVTMSGSPGAGDVAFVCTGWLVFFCYCEFSFWRAEKKTAH